MFKVFATDVIVSKGYANQSAVRFSEDGKIVRFRIGKKVYDKNAENNTRWFNVSVKGFGPIAERIQKMQLKEGSLIHISGTLDEESWLDQASNTTKPRRSLSSTILTTHRAAVQRRMVRISSRTVRQHPQHLHQARRTPRRIRPTLKVTPILEAHPSLT